MTRETGIREFLRGNGRDALTFAVLLAVALNRVIVPMGQYEGTRRTG